MLIEEREIRVASLRPGMYVSRLDRDWIGTPFLLQGFLVQNQEDIDLIGQYCRHVFVDIAKSENFVRPSLQRLVRPGRGGYDMPDIKAIANSRPHPVLHKIEDELPRARLAVQEARKATTEIMAGLRAGDKLSEAEVDQVVTPLVESVLRNPDAYFWLESMRQHDSYTYTHAMNCCVLMAAFGRHLGLADEALHDLATGGLLLDIGKTVVPEELLERAQTLTDDELGQVRGHVEHGLRLYDESGAGNAYVREILQTHHERENGSGYPSALAGESIPLYGRLAGIVDSYDAMTSARPYRTAVSKYEALQRMYRQRGQLFQGDLLEQFVQCLGVYPVGTLVELSTGEVAVVMAQNPVRRLFPRVMLLTDVAKKLRQGFESLDLRDTLAGKASAQISIRRCLQAGSYGLDPRELYL
jgi:HD-GYP domain-containing protein (c-di-GMP phosphodiesterase class II)